MKNIYKKNNIFLGVLYESFLKNTIESGLVFLKHQSLFILNGLVQGFCAFQRMGFLQNVLVAITALSAVFSVFSISAIVLAVYDVLVFDAYHLHVLKVAAAVACSLSGVASSFFFVLTSPSVVGRMVGIQDVQHYFDRYLKKPSDSASSADLSEPTEPVWSVVLQELTPILTSLLIEWIREQKTSNESLNNKAPTEMDTTKKSVWLSDQEVDYYHRICAQAGDPPFKNNTQKRAA